VEACLIRMPALDSSLWSSATLLSCPLLANCLPARPPEPIRNFWVANTPSQPSKRNSRARGTPAPLHEAMIGHYVLLPRCSGWGSCVGSQLSAPHHLSCERAQARSCTQWLPPSCAT
jgi:hypothetical protein